jgi:hypothetical protein
MRIMANCGQISDVYFEFTLLKIYSTKMEQNQYQSLLCRPECALLFLLPPPRGRIEVGGAETTHDI